MYVFMIEQRGRDEDWRRGNPSYMVYRNASKQQKEEKEKKDAQTAYHS